MQTGLHGILGPTGVGNLRYRPAGRGARTRTAQAKMQESCFSVKDFGAVGDGLADDTAAIQRAIAAAEAETFNSAVPAGGQWGAVYFPRGKYVTDGLALTKPIRIFGEGRAQSVLQLKANADASMFVSTITTSWFVPTMFEDITLDGNKTNQGAVFSAGINLVATTWDLDTLYSLGAVVRNCAIHNFRDAGIFAAKNRNDGVVADCLIYNCGKGISNFTFDWRLYSVDIGVCDYGYEQAADGGTELWGCNIYQHTNAGVVISEDVGSYMFFSCCSIDSNGQQGIYIDNNGALDVGTVLSQCQFTRNSASANNTYPDIHCVDANSVAVIGCTFRYLGTPKPNYLVQFAGTCGPVMWSGNHYQTSGGNAPFATAITSDFTKLVLAGDQAAQITGRSNGAFDFNSTLFTTGSSDFYAGFTAEGTNASANPGPYVTLYRNSASPAASDRIGVALFKGKDSGGNDADYAFIEAQIIDPTNGSEDGELVIGALVAGSGVNVMRISNGVQVGAPTGGYKGAGTLNATGVYDDNTLLTCPVLQPEFLEGGTVDLAKWNDLTPNRQIPISKKRVDADGNSSLEIVGHREEVRTHVIAERFASMLAEGFDPRDPAQYFQKMKSERALPGMPTEEEWTTKGPISSGELMSRIWLAMEMMAVVSMKQQEKIEALEFAALRQR